MAIDNLYMILGPLLTSLLIYVCCNACYRLIISPLSGIPGPPLAALTFWYECFYDVFLPGQYIFEIKRLHEVYGPIIRINPREVSISDPSFLDMIYAPGHNVKRDKDLEKVKALGINSSVGGAVQHNLHQQRRDSLNSFFSRKRVWQHAPELEAKVSQLSTCFHESFEAGNILNLSDVYFAFASDVVSQYCCGNNSNAITDLERAASMRTNVATVLRGVKFNLHFHWFKDLLKIMPGFISTMFVPVPKGVIDMIRFRKRIRAEVERLLSHDDDQHSKRSIFHELRDSPRLPNAEKSAQRLEDEATLLVMAGTESTAKSICIAHYYLLSQPTVMAKLREELHSESSSATAQLQQLPYLNAVIMEANRLSFGLTGRQPRISPDGPIVYIDPRSGRAYEIPAGTPVSTSTYLVHTNEDIFPDPWRFNPDRWLGEKGQERRKYMLAFSKGPRACIGIHLANAELAMVIAEMSRWDMELFETGEKDVRFLHDYHVATPSLDSLGIKVRVMKRSKELSETV